MKKIGIVVVTYNRLECLKKNIESLKNIIIPNAYEVKIFIVNNASTDGTTEWINKIADKNIEVLNLKENTGGSGGFYNGIKYAVEKKVDYIWGMDDDAYPEPNSLEEIIKILDIEGENACYWSNCNKDVEFESPYKKVEHWMFVGFFISTKIVKEVGYPRKDFFIYHDDIEYSRRIIKGGHNIFKVRSSIIDHKDAVSNNYEGKFLGKNIKIPQLPDWKMYYLVRNGLLMYSKKEKEFWYSFFIITPKLILKVLVLKPSQLTIVLKAYFHGSIGKSGIIIKPK